MKNIFIYVKSIFIPVALGGIVGLITSDFMNNEMLVMPNFVPPAVLFPIVWTILYILMGISYGILKSNSLANDKANIIYYTQLFVNLFWSIIFFVFKWRFIFFGINTKPRKRRNWLSSWKNASLTPSSKTGAERSSWMKMRLVFNW